MVDFEVTEAKVEIDNSSWEKIFKSQAMQDELRRRCEAIAASANAASSPDTANEDPFDADVAVGKHTAMGRVYAHTPHGVYAKERILDAIGAGGD